MASEIRKIAFNLSELYQALEIFAKKTGKVIPSKVLSGVKAGAGGSILFDFDGGDHLALRDKDIIAALLVFCRDRQIPVPKGGKKIVKAEGKMVTLMIKL